MGTVDLHLAANSARARGSLEDYDAFRPGPPSGLARLVGDFRGSEAPAVVVDLGCGTGLSTRYWSDKAERVLGIDPNAEMLGVARAKSSAANTSYQQGFAHETQLAEASVDVAACSQAIHWMDPELTIGEVARILRPGGVWVAVSYGMPLIHWRVNQALLECLRKAGAVSEKLGLRREEKRWCSGHAELIERSGQFKFVCEHTISVVETGDVKRLLGFVRSLASVRMPLERCGSEAAVGLDVLAETARSEIGDRAVDWHWSFVVILAVR